MAVWDSIKGKRNYDFFAVTRSKQIIFENISFTYALFSLMKKFFTIPFVVLILLAGMHITVASHFCGGKLAATKVSVTGSLASCGMTHNVNSKASSEITLSSNCCQDETSVYKVDESFSTSEFHFKNSAQNLLLEFYTPSGHTFHSNPFTFILYNTSPPGDHLANAVSMADICVFRI
jgi:hypothetical protein